MGSVYSLVQYALDTLGDDHLTVGMIAIDEDGSKAATAFVPNWRRARCFGAGGTEFLESFAKSLAQKAGGPNDFIPPQITVDELEEMSRDYRNAIRLTAPTRIDLSATEWVRDYAHLFVPDLEAHAEVERSRKTVDKIVRDTKSVMTRFLQARYRIPNASQCEQTGRRCAMLEIDPHYCDVIVQRWERFTGQTATLASALHETAAT